MPQADISAIDTGSLDDGYHILGSGSHATNRDATNSTSGSTSINAAYVGLGSVAFGTANKFNYRGHMTFNIGAASIPAGSTIDSVNLKISTQSNSSGFLTHTHMGTIYIAKGTWTASSGSSTYNDFDGWPSSGDWEGVVTEYGEFTSAASTDYDISLNSTAVSDVEDVISSGYLKLMFLYDGEWDEDYTLTGTGFVVFNGAKIITMENTTASKRPVLEVVYTSGGVTYNANIFGANF
tara:strand:- start:16595 stop:17305 length:711 start_codon:yes stop_codon:yes gene_type:complete